MYPSVHWRSEDNVRKSVLSFHHEDPETELMLADLAASVFITEQACQSHPALYDK